MKRALLLLLSCAALLAGCATNPAPSNASPKGSGDLGVVIERARGTLAIVDTSERTLLAEVPGLGDLSHASVVFSRDGGTAFVFGRDGALTRVNLLARRIEQRVMQAGNSIGGAVSQDGTLVAAQNYQPGGVKVFDAKTLALVADIPAEYAPGQLSRVVGLVDLPGFPDVRVYLDNREAGRTDSSGKLLLPDLRPYERNQIRVAVDDLPLDAEITTAETEAVPYDGSGMRIGFPLARTERATVVLHDAQGAPLPAGLKLASADGKVTAWVARDGFSQVTGPLGEGAALAGSVAGARLTCKLPAPAGKEPLPDLGTVTCR